MPLTPRLLRYQRSCRRIRVALLALALTLVGSACDDDPTGLELDTQLAIDGLTDATDTADTADDLDAETDSSLDSSTDGSAADVSDNALANPDLDVSPASDIVDTSITPDGLDSSTPDASSNDSITEDLDVVDGLTDATNNGDASPDLDSTDALETSDSIGDLGDVDMSTPFDDLAGLTEAALEAALLDRIDDHTSLTYSDARVAMYNVTNGIDVDDAGLLTCLYTAQTVISDGTTTPGSGAGEFNTEHVWPQSQGADIEPMRSDMHHIFPTLATANTARGADPFGESDCDGGVGCFWAQGGSESGLSTVTPALRIFEVRPESRGNVARAVFYFAVRYQMDVDPEQESFLRGWHTNDPPDSEERARNDEIELVQINRNPFVDRPDFVGLISDF